MVTPLGWAKAAPNPPRQHGGLGAVLRHPNKNQRENERYNMNSQNSYDHITHNDRYAFSFEIFSETFRVVTKQLLTSQITSGCTQYPQLASVPMLYRSRQINNKTGSASKCEKQSPDLCQLFSFKTLPYYTNTAARKTLHM